MKILGIDPGTGITGFGVIEVIKAKPKMLDAGVIRTKAHQPQGERLQIIFDCVTELIQEHTPSTLAIEKLFFNTNITTAMTVSEARGVVLLAAAKANLQIAEYTPLQIKQAMTGYGKAEKIQVQEMVKTLLKLKDIPRPDDAADGLAVALTHGFTI
ncbi:TPA: crossover junction endodeoxyribonuclease RuvC [Candidatus Saccharibacteria bacterium]|nr:crossover junction endodeoxyribonuclease RuvC [Candidatus Saccharibacteria bacterium]HIO87969.1 crossover junction endodeoxyribonuclease RuvC [Candidatus Saccharibacteria bacterium]